MQVFQLASIPARLQEAARRFLRIADKTLSPRNYDRLLHDWSVKCYLPDSPSDFADTFYALYPPPWPEYPINGGGMIVRPHKILCQNDNNLEENHVPCVGGARPVLCN